MVSLKRGDALSCASKFVAWKSTDEAIRLCESCEETGDAEVNDAPEIDPPAPPPPSVYAAAEGKRSIACWSCCCCWRNAKNDAADAAGVWCPLPNASSSSAACGSSLSGSVPRTLRRLPSRVAGRASPSWNGLATSGGRTVGDSRWTGDGWWRTAAWGGLGDDLTERKSDESEEDEVRSCSWYVGWAKGPRSSSPPRRAPGKKGMEAGLRAALLAMAGNVAGGNKEGWGRVVSQRMARGVLDGPLLEDR